MLGGAGFVLLAGLCWYFAIGRRQKTSARRLPNRYTGVIEEFHSTRDEDGDGVDDQRDILEGALAYIATRPKYQSAYYPGGYPDDGYGVCTDVVARALKTAGYDLQPLVEKDRKSHPKDYGEEAPDPNIDFRRVRNLKVYFSHTAISLTTDVHAIDQWQGGDIVIFTNHIGIVSDHRNKRGVCYVIHHSSPMQWAYEEDILEKRGDLEAHYRISP